MIPRISARTLVGFALALCAGCYDGKALVREARSSAVPTRLAEIDLGKFLTTLPRDQKDSSFTDLEVHLFATVPRSRLSAAKKHLQAEEYRLRHELLAAIRSAPREELAEPSLKLLRRRVEQVVNPILGDTTANSIGFYAVTLRRR
jgi:hypothetical protein